MLSKRILTALVLGPVVVFGVLYLSPSWFSLVVGITTCFAAWEYCRLINLSGFSNRSFYVLIVLACAFLLAISPTILAPMLFLTTAWWLAALFFVVGFPKRSDLLKNSKTIGLANGFFLFAPMAASLAMLHLQERSLVLLLLFSSGLRTSVLIFREGNLAEKSSVQRLAQTKPLRGSMAEFYCLRVSLFFMLRSQ